MESINIKERQRKLLIVDLNLKGNLVIVVGGGNEGLKKVNALLTQDCKILLVSDSTNKQIEKVFKRLIKKEDIYQIKLQDFARRAAKAKIATFPERRKFLYSVMNDNHIKQLIKAGNLKKAQKRVIEMLGDLN